MHPEILALVQPYLPPAVARDLDALVARLLGASFAPTLVAAAEAVALPDPDHVDTLVASDEPTPDTQAPDEVGSIPPRYEDLGRIGVGGMGEVRRVRDRELGRSCAYKVLKSELVGKASAMARFVEEAQVAAQLQHPNIAPVYDAGRLGDGRIWFTMKEVRGQTVTELIRGLHAGELTDAAFRRLGDVFAKVCDGVGYAHARGVVHRDLKPENVMVGAHGEVLVLDWGLAKLVGRADLAVDDQEPELASTRSADRSQRTRVGGVLGTPAYMAPEQARGRVDEIDARTDVYALGAILYEMLSGSPPYLGHSAVAVLRQVLAGPPPPLGGASSGETFAFGVEGLEVEAPTLALPEELVALCGRCMARDTADRPADGAAVAREARAWLDGARRRQKALDVVAAADGLVAEVASLRERARLLRAAGDALLLETRPWDPEEAKAPGWRKQDEAEQAEREASRLELEREALLVGALTHAPELAEAHVAILELGLSSHRAAEVARSEGDAARAEVRLREHAGALPAEHPTRVRVAAYLEGHGALSLQTDPPGAEVLLSRYELRDRRLVEVPVRSLGRAPLRAVPLPMGSYLCRLRHPDRPEVRYPVHLGRGEHWDGVPPGARDLLPVRLPRSGELGPDDCLVPAGWFWSGGDPAAVDCLPRRRLWCDELVVRRFPVTNWEYLAFLDGLVASGREAEAVRHQPRERAAGEGSPVYGRDEAGRFALRADADGDVWDPDYPVFLVDWFGATAYAARLAETTGRPWRLLGELEWEKVARGADGRHYPWGDHLDPSWACIRASHAAWPRPQVVDSFPADVSVHGVRGLGGNVQDWCADTFRLEGPAVEGDRVSSTAGRDGAQAASVRCQRGGNWLGTAASARSARRYGGSPQNRHENLGFRVAFGPGRASR